MEAKQENLNKLADLAENLFQSSSGSEDMWRVASKFALQLTQGQIYALTAIKFFARAASKEETKNKLNGFYEDYMLLQNQRNTALFMVQMARANSMLEFMGRGIQGQVKIDK
ncbi:hypothetical protein A2159_01320 [Candidatus Woesebacteria bacterium RBG_13_34_9]|uniref:Uncharacterized protein n=1 Tax=Candidatus Woesebacteria bacterium RBG_13_34_9 TaxID=1802477 RepID=A0A1F7X632_9BACT|nr:MAG: hypothetical protein A2159_01320 [Candidatus Woesebacteria bacterium RBG_13_34_9]